ncbi:MAG: 2-C-methyl-D-erythritol 4-phosphate cytidylyltransferase [Chlamydiae bacterium]|nr:2-C-methyl-D-erythritol 4-phosphate cytidylyltransferase [Chlamydiota bacterium]
MKYFISAILLAGGRGSRFASELPKQFLPLGTKLIVHHSLELLLNHPLIDEIIIVCAKNHQEYFSNYTSEKIRFAPPGDTRQGSVREGLLRASPDAQFLCIHDSARPLVQQEDLDLVIEEGVLWKAAALGTLVKNTIKQVDRDGIVMKTVERDMLWEVQTPQVISAPILWEGLAYAKEHNITATDDLSLAECLGYRCRIVAGSERNIKITTPDDMTVALSFLDKMYAQV